MRKLSIQVSRVIQVTEIAVSRREPGGMMRTGVTIPSLSLSAEYPPGIRITGGCSVHKSDTMGKEPWCTKIPGDPAWGRMDHVDQPQTPAAVLAR